MAQVGPTPHDHSQPIIGHRKENPGPSWDCLSVATRTGNAVQDMDLHEQMEKITLWTAPLPPSGQLRSSGITIGNHRKVTPQSSNPSQDKKTQQVANNCLNLGNHL